jgi:hypothetical protein
MFLGFFTAFAVLSTYTPQQHLQTYRFKQSRANPITVKSPNLCPVKSLKFLFGGTLIGIGLSD